MEHPARPRLYDTAAGNGVSAVPSAGKSPQGLLSTKRMKALMRPRGAPSDLCSSPIHESHPESSAVFVWVSGQSICPRHCHNDTPAARPTPSPMLAPAAGPEDCGHMWDKALLQEKFLTPQCYSSEQPKAPESPIAWLAAARLPNSSTLAKREPTSPEGPSAAPPQVWMWWNTASSYCADASTLGSVNISCRSFPAG